MNKKYIKKIGSSSNDRVDWHIRILNSLIEIVGKSLRKIFRVFIDRIQPTLYFCDDRDFIIFHCLIHPIDVWRNSKNNRIGSLRIATERTSCNNNSNEYTFIRIRTGNHRISSITLEKNALLDRLGLFMIAKIIIENYNIR